MQPTKVQILAGGNWNRRLFNATWMANNVFDINENDNVEGLMNPEEVEIGFKHNHVTITPKDNLLDIEFDNIEPETLTYGNRILIRILDLLPHTPIKSINYNYYFDIEEKSNSLFVQYCKTIYKNEVYNDFKMNLFRIVKKDDKNLLSIVVSRLDTSYDIAFNFSKNLLDIKTEKDILFNLETAQSVLENGK